MPGDKQLVILEGAVEDNVNTEFHMSRIEELKTHKIEIVSDELSCFVTGKYDIWSKDNQMLICNVILTYNEYSRPKVVYKNNSYVLLNYSNYVYIHNMSIKLDL